MTDRYQDAWNEKIALIRTFDAETLRLRHQVLSLPDYKPFPGEIDATYGRARELGVKLK